MRRRVLVAPLLAAAASASVADVGDALEDFRARQAQAVWNVQMIEGMVRPMPESDRERPTPPAVAAQARLLSENIGELQKIDLAAATDEQRRQAAEGWLSLARQVRDIAALARIRRFDRLAQHLTEQEARCRTALKLL